MRFRSSALALSLLAFTSLAHADSMFTFNGYSDGTPLPVTRTNAGLTATFSGQASVCDTTGVFSSLSGNAVVQSFCGSAAETGPLSIGFSKNVGYVSFDFGTPGGSDTISVQEFENGTLVGTEAFTSAVPTNFFNGEGLATLSGAFNSIRISSPDASSLAYDNVEAVLTPEPSSLLLLGTGALGMMGMVRRRRVA